jgi:hypothetical protein
MFYTWEMPCTSLFKSGPIAGKSVSHGPTFAGEQWISFMLSMNASEEIRLLADGSESVTNYIRKKSVIRNLCCELVWLEHG